MTNVILGKILSQMNLKHAQETEMSWGLLAGHWLDWHFLFHNMRGLAPPHPMQCATPAGTPKNGRIFAREDMDHRWKYQVYAKEEVYYYRQ